MRGRSFGCDQPAAQKIRTFRCAAEDAWDATRFLLSNVCPGSRIVLCGSSAGAEAVLHAAYWPEPLLPAGFRYAGVIGMAAAVLDLDWITPESALPSLLFHGVDDPLVPFGSASHHYCREGQPGFLLLHGSGSIAQHLEALRKPVALIKGDSGGHGWADKPMFEYVDRIISFLEREIA
jgi:acetyl esterase/lipase